MALLQLGILSLDKEKSWEIILNKFSNLPAFLTDNDLQKIKDLYYSMLAAGLQWCDDTNPFLISGKKDLNTLFKKVKRKIS